MKKPLDSSKVLEHVKKVKKVTTQTVADKFKVKFQQAAAAIAILRIKEVIKPDSPSKDSNGISRWIWCG